MTRTRPRNAREMRAILRNRPYRCGPKCRGWFVTEYGNGSAVAACDECRYDGDGQELYDDRDVLLLPAAARAHQRALPQGRLILVLAISGSQADAYDAARRVLDAGTLQDAMHEYSGAASQGRAFAITNAEVKVDD